MCRLEMGAQQQEDGSTAVFLICWIALRLLVQEPLIIHENVEQFKPELLQEHMGHVYAVQSVVVDAYDLGWPISRVRRYP